MKIEDGVFGKREGLRGGEMKGTRKLVKVWSEYITYMCKNGVVSSIILCDECTIIK